MKKFSKLVSIMLVLCMCLSLAPVTALFAAASDEADAEGALHVATTGSNTEDGGTFMRAETPTAAIDDGTIKVEVDQFMNMTVFRKDGDVWTPMTGQVEPLGPDGATAQANAWRNSLPWSSTTGSGSTGFPVNSAKILSAKTGYVTQMTTGRRITQGHDANEAVFADDFVADLATGMTFSENVQTHFGLGDRLEVTGKSASTNLQRKLVIETSASVPGAVAVSTYYRNLGETDVIIDKFVENNFKIEDVTPEQINGSDADAGIWAYFGGAVGWTRDYIMPVFDYMGRGTNPTGNYLMTVNRGGDGYPGSNEYTLRNNWNWTTQGCVPQNNFYGTNIGITVGSFMPYHTFGLEIPVRGSGLNNNHNIAYTWVGWPGRTLAGGESGGPEAYIGTSFIGVHAGDYYDANSQYADAMSNINSSMMGAILPNASVNKYREGLITQPNSKDMPDWAWAPIYETWGYGIKCDPANTMDILPELLALGVQSVTLDDGWYERTTVNGEGMYKPGVNPGSAGFYDWSEVAAKLRAYYGLTEAELPCNTSDDAVKVVAKFVDYFHEHGIKVVAWCMPSLARINATSKLFTDHPDWFARSTDDDTIFTNTVDGGDHGQSQAGITARYFCLANPGVIDDFTDYFVELFFKTYGFDGIKADALTGSPLCRASTHGHGDGTPGNPVDIEACVQGYGLFYKTLYDKANLARGATETLGGPIVDRQKTTIIMNCNCGTTMDYYGWSGVTRPVPGDVVGSRAVRNMVKSYRGFYDSSFPIAGDHMWLSKHRYGGNGGTTERPGPPDYITYLGIGAVYDTKYITDRYRTTLNLQDRMQGLQMIYPGQEKYTIAVGPTSGTNFNQEVNRTARYVYKWGDFIKYFGLYNDLKISQAEFMNLYKYGFDFPEGYAFKQDEQNYYFSFYRTIYGVGTGTGQGSIRNISSAADPWGNGYYSSNIYNGPIELRGLKPGVRYYATNVETGEQFEGIAGADGKLTIADIEFATGIVFKVSEKRTASISGIVTGKEGAVVPGAELRLLNYDGTPVAGISPTAADLKGFYAFPIVPPGSYMIRVTANKDIDGKPYPGVAVENTYEYRSLPVTVPEGANRMDIDLTAGTIDIIAGVNGSSKGFHDLPVEFNLWLETFAKIENVNGIEIVFTVDQNLGFLDVIPAAGLGFGVISPTGGIVWASLYNDAGEYIGARGTLSLIKLDNGFVTLEGLVDYVKLAFTANDLGNATITLDRVSVVIHPDGQTPVMVTVDISEEFRSATTDVVYNYSIYDLNKDKKVDFLDVTIAALAIYKVKGEDDWDDPVGAYVSMDILGNVITLAMCDVSQGGAGDGIIDMLDLLDIMRHYT